MQKRSKLKRAINAILFSSIQESFIALTLAYFLNVIYLIGDTRQLIPLLLGLVIGTVIFSSVSIFSSNNQRKNFILKAIIVVILLLIVIFMVANLLIFNTWYQYSNLILALIGGMIISPILLVQNYSREIFEIDGRSFKAIVFSISSLLMLIIILIFSELYELGGQMGLSIKIEVYGGITILLTLLEIYVVKNRFD